MKSFFLMFLCFMTLISNLALATTTRYAFWGTAAKDGYVYANGITPCFSVEAAAVDGTGTTGSLKASYDGEEIYTISRVFFSFNTAALTGLAVSACTLKIVMAGGSSTDGWTLTHQFDFRETGCISSSLAKVDTTCYQTADTTISGANLPAQGDTLKVGIRPTWVNTTGATDVIVKLSVEQNVCAATADNIVSWRMTEWGGTATASDPRLYVWVEEPPAPSQEGLRIKPRIFNSEWIPIL